MNTRPTRGKDWLPYAGFMLAVAGIVWQGGQQSATIERNTERITKLEASDQARSDALNAINVRTARIEAKLDFYMPKEPAK